MTGGFFVCFLLAFFFLFFFFFFLRWPFSAGDVVVSKSRDEELSFFWPIFWLIQQTLQWKHLNNILNFRLDQFSFLQSLTRLLYVVVFSSASTARNKLGPEDTFSEPSHFFTSHTHTHRNDSLQKVSVFLITYRKLFYHRADIQQPAQSAGAVEYIPTSPQQKGPYY